jgi:glutamate dehydrogenase
VQATIRENARLEFETLWREGEATGESRSILSDRLSLAITRMDEELQATELWDNVELRRSVLGDALPKLLLQQIGLDSILERVRFLLFSFMHFFSYYRLLTILFQQVPDAYLRAIFGSFLASRFIYSMGISASPVSFFAFMNKRMAKSAQALIQ